MSDATAPGAVGATGGRYAVGANRLVLGGILVGGKTLDAVSTVVVLSLRENVSESVWLTRELMASFGLVPGTLLAVVVAVVGVALLAETGALLAWLFPDDWTPAAYPRAFRVVVYCSSGVWYAALGVHNVSLLT